MHKVRTTINPELVIVVDDRELASLKADGLLAKGKGSRATEAPSDVETDVETDVDDDKKEAAK